MEIKRLALSALTVTIPSKFEICDAKMNQNFVSRAHAFLPFLAAPAVELHQSAKTARMRSSARGIPASARVEQFCRNTLVDMATSMLTTTNLRP